MLIFLCGILFLLQSLNVLTKALAGDVPWSTYTRLLQHCHSVSKDHATASDTAKYIQQLVTGVSRLTGVVPYRDSACTALPLLFQPA
jgi:hypothetical protein